MGTRLLRWVTIAILLCWAGSAVTAATLDEGFKSPPDSARPWVYWFWLNGNITREGITADLEAMKRVGIGGVLIMEVDQGAPVGPVDFMGARVAELFAHVVAEAKRLGLEVNMNDDAGWNGSGGPWIKPEQSMQKVVCSETEVAGPQHFDVTFSRSPRRSPGSTATSRCWRSPRRATIASPGSSTRRPIRSARSVRPRATALPPEMAIPRDRIVDLSASMDAAGRLDVGRSRGQVDDHALRPHEHRRAERARAGQRPRSGMRQAQQGRLGSQLSTA